MAGVGKSTQEEEQLEPKLGGWIAGHHKVLGIKRAKLTVSGEGEGWQAPSFRPGKDGLLSPPPPLWQLAPLQRVPPFQPPLGSLGPAPPLGLCCRQGRGQAPQSWRREPSGAGGGLAVLGLHGWASGLGAPATSPPFLSCPQCLPDFCFCLGPLLTSLPAPSGRDLGAKLSGVPGPMQCRILRGLAGALVTLLCMGLLSLWYHSNLSPQGMQETPGLSPPSPRPPELQLHDVFIAVKTTRAFHHSRLELLLDTWVSRTREQTFIFTDSPDKGLQERLGSHLVVTNCSAEHSHPALSCKMAAEFDAFLASGLRWFCHVDDDNYVNPPALLKLLKTFPRTRDVYVGRPSLNRPIHASEPQPHNRTRLVQFWFATGGAGFCINRKLALRMAPWASGPRFVDTSALIRLPDDCTVGYIVGCKLGGHLQPSPLFHSHLETLQLLGAARLPEQVTLSYGVFEGKLNVIKLQGPFSPEEDPSRFRSLHCLLYPDTPWCPQLVAR